MHDIRVGEMFCGIGGFRLGLENANPKSDDGAYEGEHQTASATSDYGVDVGRDKGQASYRVLWANDNDRYACQIYRKHYGDAELVEGDIRDIPASKIPDIDLLCAGFPCQNYSIAGKREGIGTARGTLFAQIVRVAASKRPRILLLENVKGLLSSNDGRDFAIILRTLGNLGFLLQWEVLNSQYFGVPQNRERIFIIGYSGADCFRQIFPIEQANRNIEAPHRLESSEGLRVRSDNPPVTANALRSRYYKDGQEILICQQHSFSGENGTSRGFRFYEEGVVPALTQNMGTGGNNVPLVAPDIIRRLTPVECERLQSFPDGWSAKGLLVNGEEVTISDTQRYKTLGNAITCNVVEYLGRLILQS